MNSIRHYYAAYNHYGIMTRFNEYNVPFIHIFESKKDRDDWVNEDWEHRQEMTRDEFRKWKSLGPDYIEEH